MIKKLLHSKYFYLVIFLSQFVIHGRIGDDWPNSQRSAWIKFRYGEVSWFSFWKETKFHIASWIEGQGRFYPINIITDSLYHTLARSDLSRNIVHVLIYLCLLITWMSIVKKTFGSNLYFFVFLLSLFATTRFRNDFDPHISFGILLPTVLLLLGLSVLTAIACIETSNTKKAYLFNILSAILFFASLCTYELSIFLFPAILLILNGKDSLANRKKLREIIRNSWALTFLTMFYIVLVFAVLRPKTNQSYAYVLDFSFGESLRIFLINLFAVIPLLNLNFTNHIFFPNSMFAIMKLLIAIISILKLRNIIFSWLQKEIVISNINKKSKKKDKNSELIERKALQNPIILMWLGLIIGPAAMISIQSMWWDRMSWGSSYLGILFQELGFSILITHSIFIIVSTYVQRRENSISKYLSVELIKFLTSILVLVSIITFSSNLAFVEGTKEREPYSKLWQAATNNNYLFQNVGDKDVVISQSYNDAYDINVADLFQRKDLRLAGMISPDYLWNNYNNCSNKMYEDCPLTYKLEDVQRVIGNGSQSQNDWPDQMSKKGALDESKFWFFNTTLFTKNEGVAYIFPIDTNSSNLSIDIENGRVISVNLNQPTSLNISMNGQCLAKIASEIEVVTDLGEAYMSIWKFELGENLIQKKIDPRYLSIGIC